MTGDVFEQNVFYCLLFVISGVIILLTLKRFGLRIAFGIFGTLFAALSLYIPFYFGNTVFGAVLMRTFDKSSLSGVYSTYMGKTLDSPLPFVRSVSVFTAIAALFAIAALIILTVTLIVKLYHYASELHIAVSVCTVNIKARFTAVSDYVRYFGNTYKLLLKLRN